MKGRAYPISDFDSMEFNPFAVPTDGTIMGYYEHLSRRPDRWSAPEFVVDRYNKEVSYKHWSNEDCSVLLSIIVLSIDNQSPLYRITDIDYKLECALATMGSRGKIQPHVVEEVLNNSFFFEKVMTNFFKVVNDYQYEEWFTKKSLYHYLTSVARDSTSGLEMVPIADRLKANKELKSLREEIAIAQQSLFPSERTAKIISRQSEADDLGGFVEEYAMNEDPLLNGYESDAV